MVKISYGKGSMNPVSGPTAFYEPKKTDRRSEAGVQATGEGADAELEAVRREMEAQNSRWSVGVVPQGQSCLWVYVCVKDTHFSHCDDVMVQTR
jgi:hypothetical protein